MYRKDTAAACLLFIIDLQSDVADDDHIAKLIDAPNMKKMYYLCIPIHHLN